MLHAPMDALLLPPGHGEGLWHLDTLWTFKIPEAASGGSFSLAEQLIPKGSAPPVHRHTREDEAWIVLDGEVTFFIDDEQHPAGPGTYVFGPRGRAHTHRVESDTARIATLLIPAPAKPSSAPPDDRPNPSPSHRRSSPTWTGCWQACANTASSSSLRHRPSSAGQPGPPPRHLDAR